MPVITNSELGWCATWRVVALVLMYCVLLSVKFLAICMTTAWCVQYDVVWQLNNYQLR